MSADQSIGGSKETAPLTVSDIAQLKRYIFSRENFFGELFGVLVIVAMVIMAEAPPILERKANLLDGLFLLFFIILFFFSRLYLHSKYPTATTTQRLYSG
jgi:hypothetical protein